MALQKRTFFIVIFALAVMGLGLVSCDNDRNLVPAFIVITKEDITIHPSLTLGKGSTAHDISDVWIKVNGKHLGCWELPARIPVLEEGSCTIVVSAGIVLNGMKSSRSAYSFFKSFETTVNLELRTETRLYPEFAYAENVTFPFIENFEEPGTQLTADSSSQAEINKIDDPNLIYRNLHDPSDINTYSGFVELKDTADYFDLRSGKLALIKDGTHRTFFEFNYKTESWIGIELIAISSSGIEKHYPLVEINPSAGQWKKMYVDLSQVVGQNYAAESFKLQITGIREGSNKAVKFYFDNLRILQQPSYY